MKSLKGILIAAVVFTGMQASAQTDKATTAKAVENKQLVFNATSALPMSNAEVNAVLSKMQGGMGGGVIQLSGAQYQFTIAKDSVEAYLPYFGRAYTANMNPNESGIKFKSKDFTYKSEKKKKGDWIITITPKDARDVQTLTLNVGVNGYAMLSVNSNNRQNITYNGYISEPKEEKN